MQKQKIKQAIHDNLLSIIDLREIDASTMKDPTFQQQVKAKIKTSLEGQPWALKNSETEKMMNEVITEAIGLGPLEILLRDPAVTEIMVNGHNHIFVEHQGTLKKTPLAFMSDESMRAVIQRIISPLGRRIDESSPMVDARLPDGSRVNVIIPPLSLIGPVITIRKFSKQNFTLRNLVDMKSLSGQAAQFIDFCVKHKKNIIIAGGTGSGKTTFLNAVSKSIGKQERVVTIEDAAELKLSQDHVISLETRPANVEGQGLVAIRDLLKNALRMRPDRIIIGECRGEEALDMLQAMNTGHDGSLTTLHANSPRDALSRLETMILMAGFDLPLKAIRDQISSSVDIVVYVTRDEKGQRRVTHITEVGRTEGEIITMNHVFELNRNTQQLSFNQQQPRFFQDLPDTVKTAAMKLLFGEAS
jgi:pilus assembly protein CpaF